MTATVQKALICLTFLAVLAIAYTHIGASTMPRSGALSLMTSLDEAIPLMPEMVFAYVSIYFFWTPAIFMSSVTVGQFSRLVFVMGIALFLGLAIHQYMPSAYPRPTLPASDSSFSVAFLRWYYTLDHPNNTFPSTHCVAVIILLCFMRERLRPLAHFAYEVWGSLIFASTVLIKQHYIVDVVGGIILGAAVFLILSWPRAPEIS